MKRLRARITYANVMSSIAVFLVLGGATAFAAGHLGKNTVGTKQLKKNSVTTAKLKKNAVTTAKIKNGAVTGAKVNLATLGTVPSATDATNAANVSTVKTFSAGANNKEMVSLVKTPNFELMGICDPNSEFSPPGVQFTLTGTAFVIYNRGAAPAFADSEDDEDAQLLQNEGVVFNYDDNGDGGEAMSTDGHFLAAPSWANLQADVNDVNNPNPGDNYPFPTTCHFAGAAFVG